MSSTPSLSSLSFSSSSSFSSGTKSSYKHPKNQPTKRKHHHNGEWIVDFLSDQLPIAKKVIEISKILQLVKNGATNKCTGSTQTFLVMLAYVKKDRHISPWALATWTDSGKDMINHFGKIMK